MGLDDQVKYRLELYLALKVPMAEISKESDKVRRREKRSSLIKGDQTRSMTTNITKNVIHKCVFKRTIITVLLNSRSVNGTVLWCQMIFVKI